MKKSILLIVLLCLSQIVFPDPNYKNGNGTIITASQKDGVKTTIRKCIISNIKIGDCLPESNRTIYKNYTFNKSIGKLKDNDIIDVLEICTIEYLNKPADKWGKPAGEVWFKIQHQKSDGYICVCKDFIQMYSDPYYEDRYEVLEEIQTSKKWTVRKLEQLVSIWEKTNIRDKPGLDGNVVSHTHNFELGTRSPQETYEILAITEETETIDKFKDHWLKIEYEPGKFGWIFGGYASVERGGMKYYLPEDCVIYQLTWY